MENRISAIIIDPLKKEHDYNHITTEGTIWDTRYGEKGFELHVYQNAKKLYENLSMHRSVDCIVTFDYCDADDFMYSIVHIKPFEKNGSFYISYGSTYFILQNQHY